MAVAPAAMLNPYFTPTNPFAKDVWLPGAYSQLEGTPGLFFNLVDQQEPVRAEGRKTFFKLDIGDSLGQGMVPANGGDFPIGINSDWSEAQVTLARLAHTATMSMDEWEMLQNTPAAAVPIVAHKTRKAVQKMTRELSRQTHMDGLGEMAVVASATGNVITVRDASTTTNPEDRDWTRWTAPRRVVIDVVAAATGLQKALGYIVTARDVAAKTLTVTPRPGQATLPTLAAGDRITWAGSVDAFSAGTYTSGEFAGLQAMMKPNSTFCGLSGAGNDYWNPVYIAGAVPGTPEILSLNRIQKLYVAMADWAEDGMQPGPNSGHALFSDHGVAATAIAVLSQVIRYVNPFDQNTQADFGFTEIEGLGIRWLTDVHYYPRVLDCLHLPDIHFVRPMNPMQGILDYVTTGSGDMWHLLNAQGATNMGHASGMNAYLTGLFGMMTYQRNAHGRLDDVGELMAPP